MIKSITKNGNSTMIKIELPTMPVWLAKMIAEKEAQKLEMKKRCQEKELMLKHTK